MYFIVFWTLVKWARAADLIRPSVAAKKGVIDTADFYALIIYILSFPKAPLMDIKNQIRVIKLSELTQSIFQLKTVDLIERYQKIGEMILSFLKEISQKGESIVIKWSKICGSEDVKYAKIEEDVMIDIAFLARKAYHYLVIQRNVEGLMEYFMRSEYCTEFSKVLPTTTSFAIGKVKQFHSALLAANAGARVRINAIAGKKTLPYLGKGNKIAAKKIKRRNTIT